MPNTIGDWWEDSWGIQTGKCHGRGKVLGRVLQKAMRIEFRRPGLYDRRDANKWIHARGFVAACRLSCRELAGVARPAARRHDDGKEPSVEMVSYRECEVEGAAAGPRQLHAGRVGRE